MTALVSEYAEAVGLPPVKTRQKGQRQEHRRCIYCTIVVDEGVIVKELIEWEGFTETDLGPVCDVCADDPLAAERLNNSHAQDTRRASFRKGVLMTRDGALKREKDPVKIERNEHIWRMAQAGFTYNDIAKQVGITASTIGGIVRSRRKRILS